MLNRENVQELFGYPRFPMVPPWFAWFRIKLGTLKNRSRWTSLNDLFYGLGLLQQLKTVLFLEIHRQFKTIVKSLKRRIIALTLW